VLEVNCFICDKAMNHATLCRHDFWPGYHTKKLRTHAKTRETQQQY